MESQHGSPKSGLIIKFVDPVGLCDGINVKDDASAERKFEVQRVNTWSIRSEASKECSILQFLNMKIITLREIIYFN